MLNHDALVFLGALAALLAAARLLGEIAARLGQPMVLGEIAAGILLGPSFFGHFYPQAQAALFPAVGPAAVALQAVSLLAVTLFLFAAGLEIDLKLVRQERRSAAWVGLLGVVVPFAVGFFAARWAPVLFGAQGPRASLSFSLFFATAMSITALPVIIKTLLDLKLYRTDVGTVIVSAAVVNDLAGWLVFALTLSVFHSGLANHLPVWQTLAYALGFGALLMTVGRRLINGLLPFLQAHATWPGAVISFSVVLALAGAAFTEWIGIHAVLGALLVGVAIGNSPRLRPRTRGIIERFVLFVFAPLFFAAIGLRIDFIRHFDGKLFVAVFLLATLVKVIACGAGALLGGMPWKKALMVGFGMNARGAMEIVLATVALQARLITPELFVALVLMALATSALSGPILRLLMEKRKVARFSDFLHNRRFVLRLNARTPEEAVAQLAKAAAPFTRLDPDAITREIMAREKLVPSGVDGKVAVPHATFAGLKDPFVAVGLSEMGVDFKASDESRAHVVVLLLVGKGAVETEIEILEDITDTFSRSDAVERALEATSYTDFLAVVKTSTNEYG